MSRPRRISDDVRRELDAHVALAAQELVDAGWEPDAAVEEARRRLGDFERFARAAEREAEAAQRSGEREHAWESVAQDLRVGVRSLLRTPGFAVIAVTTLALGIGCNAAIFSVVHAVLLRPLPYEQPDRIVAVAELNSHGRPMRASGPDLQDWRAQARGFDAIAGYETSSFAVLGGDRPVRATEIAGTEDFWRVLPVRPALGRLSQHEDHRPGAAPIAIVSHRFWTGALGRAADVLDRPLTVGEVRARIVGVLPADFALPQDADLFVAAESVEPPNPSRSAHNWIVLGRLRPTVDPGSARRELDAITARGLEGSTEDPDYLAKGTAVTPWLENLVGDSRRPLWLLLGAAGLVLLVACTNLASTLLARGETRATEMAVRSSLGAGRGRLVRQLLTESLVLAAGGAAGAVGLAALARRALLDLAPAAVPRLAEVSLDPLVLAFTAALAVATLMLFALWPALRLSREGPAHVLRAARSGRGSLVWSALVGVEVTLATVLLSGSSLLIQSLRRVLAQDAGFDEREVLIATVSPSAAKHGDAVAIASVYDELTRAVTADRSINAAGISTAVPMKGFPNGRVRLDDDPGKIADAGYVVASQGFFDALDIPLLAGRLFDERDRADAPDVALVSRSFAERYWPGESPLGHQVSGGGMDDTHDRPATVIGVVGDVRFESLTRAAYPTIYFSPLQRPFRPHWGAFLAIEPQPGRAAEAIAAYRSAAARIDADLPVEIVPLSAGVAASLGERRFVLVVLGAFAAAALALALVGIYGVVSYRVARRRRELGIRLALGAGGARVLTLVVGGTMRSVALGLAAGLAISLALGRLLRSLLYDVSPADPLALGSSLAAIAAAALLASWLPAQRTTRIDPSIAMRSD